MIRYRISKYNPIYRNKEGKYIKEDWTSVTDIGNLYEGKVLTTEEYLKNENNYIKVIMDFMQIQKITELKIEKLEKNFTVEEIRKRLDSKRISFSEEDIKMYQSLKNGLVLKKKELRRNIILMLRECFWCKLISATSEFTVELGYDYYMYISTSNGLEQQINAIKKRNIYIEKESEIN